MQGKEMFCLQCGKSSFTPSNRLVQDSCGHKKCRSCLLDDEVKCKQCFATPAKLHKRNNIENTFSPPEITDNHTAVIQCNGKARLTCDKAIKDDIQTKFCPGIKNVKTENKPPKETSIKAVTKKEPKEVKKPRSANKKKIIIIPEHIVAMSDPVSYYCNICKKMFTTKSHVKYHRYCAGDLKPYKCKVCEKEFILRVQLQIHMYKHADAKPFACNVCQKSFSEKSKLTRHMILHSSEKKNVCTDCGKAFKSRESLRIHAMIHKAEKPFPCKLCSAKFNNSSNLTKHLASHSKEKAHMCDQCGRRFKLKWALSVHRKSHLRVRPHECAMCAKAFINFKDLQRHSLVHTETKGYTCSICSTSFRRRDNLHRHMKNTHPGKKGEVIKNAVKAPELAKKSVVIDNPNAINVITASPAITNRKVAPVAAPMQPPTTKSTDSRPTGSVINGPIKLAFKTPAFKSHYNIARDCNFISPVKLTQTFPSAESVDIYKKILSPTPERILRTADSSATATEISQNILTIPKADEPTLKPQDLVSFSSTLHYETSFQNRKHAMIKNIKFKVPVQYTNQFKQQNNICSNIINTESIRKDAYINSDTNVYSELKPVANTSVIVNSSTSSDVHWRRRTSQNLVLKN